MNQRDFPHTPLQKRKALRTEIQHRREQLSPFLRTKFSARIANHLISWIHAKGFKSMMFYLNMKSEVETMNLLAYMLKKEKQVCAPVVDVQNRRLVPRQIQNPDTELVRHNYGMLEPDATCPAVNLSQLKLILVPGIVFDRKGYRLGYGKGFYDRFLPKCPSAVTAGLAYELQLVDDTFPQPWDVPLEHVFTENGKVIPCLS